MLLQGIDEYNRILQVERMRLGAYAVSLDCFRIGQF